MRTAVLALVLATHIVAAQGTTVTPLRVNGWAFADGAGSFKITSDHMIARGGDASCHFISVPGISRGLGVVSQGVRADDYRGKRVRFSAFVKTIDVVGKSAGIWMRVDGADGSYAIDNMTDRPVSGTHDWIRVSAVLDVPRDAAGIMFGALMRSTGEMWIDDATFEIVGKDVPVTTVESGRITDDSWMWGLRNYRGTRAVPINLGFEP